MIVSGSGDPGIYDDPVYTISPLTSSIILMTTGVVTTVLVPSVRIFWTFRGVVSFDVTSIFVILDPHCSSVNE